jgi:hypothetical protein
MKLVVLAMVIISFASGFVQRATLRSNGSSVVNLSAKKKSTKVRSGEFWEAKMDGFRPTINDVERISWGKPAKQKGTGSRGVPHRLNEEERLLFDQARRKGFLEVAGSGWRSQRREAPLLNTFRSLCDARGQASVILHKDKSGVDELVVDISPLRNVESFPDVADECLKQAVDGNVLFQGSGLEEKQEDGEDMVLALKEEKESAWSSRPIYQLPPYCLVWKLPRSEAKALGKRMANAFDTIEGNVSPSKTRKPIGVKPGKGRRHGGYGIG